MKTILNINRSGKVIPPVDVNPRKGTVAPDAAIYPGYIVLLDESRSVMNADDFLACDPYRLIVGLFVMPVGDAHPNTYRISYIGRVQSISDEFGADGSSESIRTVNFAPVCRTGIGPYQGLLNLESVVSCNARFMDMQACRSNRLIFRPSYDMAVPNMVLVGDGAISNSITFETSFDIPQTWGFSLKTGTDAGAPGTISRSTATELEEFHAVTVLASKIALKNSGQGDDNIITPHAEMFKGTSKLTLFGIRTASFTTPFSGEWVSEAHALYYWLAFCKLKDSMTIETRFVKHGDDEVTAWSLGAASAISVLYSKIRAV